MSEKKEKTSFAFKMIAENPIFGLYLGICSTLAVSTSINNAIGMGVAVLVVLVMSNIIISAIRNIVPDEIHIPVYIVIIATLVTIVEQLLHAYTPELYSALGAFIDLIVVNCIILGRAEAFAGHNKVGASALDGLNMGLAYIFGLLLMAVIRQVLGTGAIELLNPFTNATLFSVQIIPAGYEISLFTTQTGAFLTFAVLAAATAVYKNRQAKKTAVKGGK